jgi:hypothetical protein
MQDLISLPGGLTFAALTLALTLGSAPAAAFFGLEAAPVPARGAGRPGRAKAPGQRRALVAAAPRRARP